MNRCISAVIFLVGLALFAQAACDQTCLQWPYACQTDNNGDCLANKCFYYYPANAPSQRSFNCWVCGGPGGGTCSGGDGTKTCKATTNAVWWDYQDGCDPECTGQANAFVQASASAGMVLSTGTGFLYQCQAKES